MKYQLTIDRRVNDHDHIEMHVFGTLDQARRAAIHKAGHELTWTTWVNPMTGEASEDRLNAHSSAFFFEIDPFE